MYKTDPDFIKTCLGPFLAQFPSKLRKEEKGERMTHLTGFPHGQHYVSCSASNELRENLGEVFQNYNNFQRLL